MRRVKCISGRRNPFCWRCPDKNHWSFKVFERHGSIMEDSNLTWSDMVSILHFWSFNLSVKTTASLTGISEHSIVEWHKKFRQICEWWLAENHRRIGGPGIICEVDESVIARRKHHVGRIVPQRWCFGGICPDTQQGFLVFVPRRNAATLEAHIEDNILPGTIIHSDGWAGYNGQVKTLSLSNMLCFVIYRSRLQNVAQIWKNGQNGPH